MSDFADMDEMKEVENSKSSMLDHFQELRIRIIKSLLSLFVSFMCCFFGASWIYNFLVWPYDKVIRKTMGKPAVLIFTAPQEFFLTQLKIAFYSGLLISFPIIATQAYLFAAPGLYKCERRALLPYLVATPLCFILGVSLVYFLLPVILNLFASMQQMDPDSVRIELLPKVSEYLDLVISLAFAFGIAFQLPVVLAVLAKFGLFGAETLRKKRRWAILLAFIAAAILTPPDPISQIALAIPTIILYEASILIVSLSEKETKRRY